MSAAFQHCPACDEEYVAGIVACVECGGALQPGPLPRLERGERRATPAPAAGPDDAVLPADGDVPDVELARLPGLQADQIIRALLLERIVCAAECQGRMTVHLPDQPAPAEPLAVTLPVTVFVPADRLDHARDLLQSLHAHDAIGDQWADAPHPDGGPPDDGDDQAAPPDAAPIAPTPSSMNAVWVILLGVALLVFLLAR